MASVRHTGSDERTKYDVGFFDRPGNKSRSTVAAVAGYGGTSASSSSRIKQSALYGDPWDDELAYDRDDIADKFRTFACHPIAADKLEEAIEHAWSLRDGGDVRSLMRAVG